MEARSARSSARAKMLREMELETDGLIEACFGVDPNPSNEITRHAAVCSTSKRQRSATRDKMARVLEDETNALIEGAFGQQSNYNVLTVSNFVLH
ncbi:U-box domain-containing protein 8 [Frankliniella fusca]|uniref:U-box domain-containing protein 8 n=1 Tax=Frankliniella fusca TaxID=407009 RepID=A0AAE1LWA0_9NEOP|nr:U-box domain-containing protein 8 [Frankliniella fusca]